AFLSKAASVEAFLVEKPGPRKDGWTDYVRVHRQIVWIGYVSATDTFKPLFWDSLQECWDPTLAKDGVPESVNEHVRAREVVCELGYPVMREQTCEEVAWFKYTRARSPHPAGELAHLKNAVDLSRFVEESQVIQMPMLLPPK